MALLTASEKQAVKQLALSDLYYFSKEILGYKLLNGPHEHWCNDLQLSDPETGKQLFKRRLILHPRGTYKSTIYSVAYPLWLVLRNPELSILITNAVADNAQNFLYEIKKHLRLNKKFRWLFGDLLTGTDRERQDSLTLTNRAHIRKEGSIEATGALSQITSTHYDIVICDDLVNNDDRESPTKRQKKKRWFEDIISILNPDGEMIVVGTRWHFDDLYNYIINVLNPKLKATAPDKQYSIEISKAILPDGSPAYPDIISKAMLDSLRIEKGVIEFNSQYLNDPLPLEFQIFTMPMIEKHLFDIQDIDLTQCQLYGAIDPSMGESSQSDFSSLTTLAVTPKDGICVIESDTRRRHPDRIIADIIANTKKYKYSLFVVETNQFQKYFKDQLVKQCNELKVFLPIIEIKSAIKKTSRIESLQPFISNGFIKFRKDWREAYPLLIEQLIQFPVASHDDAPDSLEMAFSKASTSGGLRIRQA